MANGQRNSTQQVGRPQNPEDDPDLISQIAGAEQPGPMPTPGIVPPSFTVYAADPLNSAKIPERVPPGTPMPSLVARAITSGSAGAGSTQLFSPGLLDATKPTLEDTLMDGQPSTAPTPSLSGPPSTLEDSLMSGPPNSGKGLSLAAPARPVGQPPSPATPPTPLSYADLRQQILATNPPVYPDAPKVPHGWGLAAAGLFATLDNAGAYLDHGTATVGQNLVKNAQALQDYNRNLPLIRRQAENQAVDEGLKQMDTAAQVNDRIAAGWKALHPNVPPPKVLFTAGGVPYAVQHGQNEYTIGDPNTPDYLKPLEKGAIDAHQQRVNEQLTQKTGPAFQQGTLDNLNKTLTDRWQVLNPGKPLPAQYALNTGATQADYDRADKALENVERATGTKAQLDTVNELKRQGAQRAADAAKEREEKQSATPIIGFDQNGHQVFTNMGNSKQLTEVRQVGQQEAEKVTNARGLLPVFDSKDPDNPGILQLVDTLEKENKLGPLASRWNEFLDGKYGKGDPDFEKLRTLMGLAQTGLMQVHVGARGSSFMLEHFQDMVNEKKMDAGTLRAGLQTELGYIKGKAMLPNGGRSPLAGTIQPGETVADGPGGKSIVFRKGKWVDPSTGIEAQSQ